MFTARAAQPGGPITVHVAPGQRSRAIALDSASSAVRVRVVSPGGAAVESPAGPGITVTRAVRILRSEQLHQTVVGLVNPRPGTYTIEALPGSPVITKVAEATDPLPARVKASVHGNGARRTLAYDIRRRPQQTVQFVEVSGSVRKPIGTVSGGRGTLAFSPAPGSDVRHIEAQFTLDGIRAETLTVASFRPPSSRLGRPAHLRVLRRASTLVVSWQGVPGATGYELVTMSPSAGQRIARTRGARDPATHTPHQRRSCLRSCHRADAPRRLGLGPVPRDATPEDPRRRAPARVGGAAPQVTAPAG